MGTYSPDRVSSKSFGPSLFHMASTFCDISSDATSDKARVIYLPQI